MKYNIQAPVISYTQHSALNALCNKNVSYAQFLKEFKGFKDSSLMGGIGYGDQIHRLSVLCKIEGENVEVANVSSHCGSQKWKSGLSLYSNSESLCTCKKCGLSEGVVREAAGMPKPRKPISEAKQAKKILKTEGEALAKELAPLADLASTEKWMKDDKKSVAKMEKCNSWDDTFACKVLDHSSIFCNSQNQTFDSYKAWFIESFNKRIARDTVTLADLDLESVRANIKRIRARRKEIKAEIASL